MDQEQKQAILARAIARMAQYTRPYIASIVGFEESDRGTHFGSAFRCMVDGRPCVITAHHVLERANKAFPGRVAISAGYGAKPHRLEKPALFDPDTDVAIVPLTEGQTASRPDVAFWDEIRIDTTSTMRSSDYLFLHGFPCNRCVSDSGRIQNRSLPYGAMEMIGEERIGTLKPFEFPIYFQRSSMTSDEGIDFRTLDPEGLSGSPVWRIGIAGSPSDAWEPARARLVGIITQWRNGEELQGREFLVATDAASIRNVARNQPIGHAIHQQ